MTKTQKGQEQELQQDDKLQKVAKYLYIYKDDDIQRRAACAVAIKYMKDGNAKGPIPDPTSLKISGRKYQDGTDDIKLMTSQNNIKLEQDLQQATSPQTFFEKIKKIFISKEKWEKQSIEKLVDKVKSHSSTQKFVEAPSPKQSTNKGMEVT
jgi:hypothetical protein